MLNLFAGLANRRGADAQLHLHLVNAASAAVQESTF